MLRAYRVEHSYCLLSTGGLERQWVTHTKKEDHRIAVRTELPKDSVSTEITRCSE